MKKELWIPQVIAGAMLLWALVPGNPYAYYVLLRWVVCPCFGYAAFHAYEKDKSRWVWVLGILAVFFNPLFPLHLNREMWFVIDLVAAGIAACSVFAFRLKA